MASNTIKILHIGNPCIRPRADWGGENFARHFREAKGMAVDAVDYMVVCGNITADGSEAAFAEAHLLIESIFETFIGTSDHKENQLIIVPGRLDVLAPDGAEPDYTRFRQLLSKIYQRDILPDELDPTTLTVRDTYDLTMIGLPGVEILGADETAVSAITRLKGQIEGICEPRKPDYLNTTPNVLISARPPLQFSPGKVYNFAPELTKLFGGIRINLHLVGCALRAVLPPANPFGKDPWCVSADLKGDVDETEAAADSLWPMRMNVVELPRTGANDPQVGARVWHLQKKEKDSPWEKRRTPVATEEAGGGGGDLREIYEDNIRRWQKMLTATKSMRGVLVQGFPGCGFRKLHQWLVEAHAQHPGEWPFFPVSWQGQDNPGFPFDAIELWKKSLSPGEMALVTVWDPELAGQDDTVYQRRADALLNFPARANLKVVHFSHYANRDLRVENFGREKLPILDAAAVNTLDKIYSGKMPMEPTNVSPLTGGYGGFLRSALDFAEERVREVNRAQSVNRETPWKLLCASWSDKDMRRDFLRFVQLLEPDVQWKFFDSIRRLLITNPLKANTLKCSLAAWRDGPDWGRIKQLLAKLRDFKVVKWDGGREFFTVNVVIPFLCQPRYRVFLSYEGYMMPKVQAFVGQVKAKAAAEQAIVDFIDYGDPTIENMRMEPQQITEMLRQRILEAKDFCLYHSGKSIIGSPWVKEEIKLWGDCHPEAVENMIIVTEPIQSALPANLQGYNLKYAGPEVADDVFNALTPAELDWSFWEEQLNAFRHQP